MSEFKASAPIEQLQGKLFGQHSSFSGRLNRLNGKQHTYYWNPDNVVVQTPARILQHVVVYKANKRATAILSDPENVRLYKQKNKLERGISSGSPRGYVLSMLIKEIKPPLKEELTTQGTIDGKTPEQWLAFLDPRSRSYHKE
ncbi:MAG: hypothetical protein MJZ58_00285 [Paludibacteraceae bacterium]|nr:hypothetical protein [Paludibacteraceae bacterium]